MKNTIPNPKVIFTIFFILYSISIFGKNDISQKDNLNDIKNQKNDSIGNFKVDSLGVTDFIIMKFDSLISSKDLYNQTMNWIKETYKTPDKVIQTSIENSMIRIEGVDKNSVTFKFLKMVQKMDLKYVIEFRIKDGKIKVDPIELFYYIAPSQYSAGGWYPMPIGKDNVFKIYNKKTNQFEVNQSFPYLTTEIPNVFNNISLSLFEFHKNIIYKKVSEDSNNDW